MGILRILVAVLGACAVASAAEPVELKVMTFNVLISGDHTPLVRTAGVIDAVGADIIGLQESHRSTKMLADVLAMHHVSFDEGRALLSKHPIVEKLRHGARIELPNRQECYVFVVHFTPYPYQPYDLRDGKLKTVEEAITAARETRGKEVEEALAEIRPVMKSGVPVFVVGDFNEPSHLDWVESTKGRHFGKVVAWPTSLAVSAAGLRDAYRVIHPDPLTHWGDTWTPWKEMPADEKHDRIDLIYFAGKDVKALEAQVVGESKERAEVAVPNYPSDHRAVVARFEVPGGQVYGRNLVRNGGAEYPRTAATAGNINWRIPEWEGGENGPVTTQFWNGYSADANGGAGVLAKPAGAGRAYFYGGEVEREKRNEKGWVVEKLEQTIDLKEIEKDVDGGGVQFALSGNFGGWHDKNDHASLTAHFVDGEGKATREALTIGNVTLAKRAKSETATAGPSGMLADSAEGEVPGKTRQMRLELKFTWCGKGGKNDACADGVSLVVRRG